MPDTIIAPATSKIARQSPHPNPLPYSADGMGEGTGGATSETPASDPLCGPRASCPLCSSRQHFHACVVCASTWSLLRNRPRLTTNRDHRGWGKGLKPGLPHYGSMKTFRPAERTSIFALRGVGMRTWRLRRKQRSTPHNDQCASWKALKPGLPHYGSMKAFRPAARACIFVPRGVPRTRVLFRESRLHDAQDPARSGEGPKASA